MHLQMRDSLKWCIVNDKVIFLDLETGRYSGLTDELERFFKLFVESPEQRHGEELDALVSAGIVQQVNCNPAPPGSIQLGRAGCDIFEYARLHCDLRDLLAAIYHQLIAELLLKTVPLHRLIVPTEAVESNTDSSSDSLCVAYAHLLAHRILPSNNRCLRRSLGLFRHLKSKHIPSSLVIAVRGRPFSAHAWVQTRNCVLNDRLERTLAYSPICVAA